MQKWRLRKQACFRHETTAKLHAMTQVYLDVSNQVALLVLRDSLAPVKAKTPVGRNGLSSAVSINWKSSACT